MSHLTVLFILVLSLLQPSITVKGPEGPYLVGDEISLILTIRYNKSLHVELPRDISLNPFIVKNSRKPPTWKVMILSSLCFSPSQHFQSARQKSHPFISILEILTAP
jgi:hypothetical protein